MDEKPLIVVSAVRFFQGGSIVIVNESLCALSKDFATDYQIKALVYKKNLYNTFPNIEFIEFPKARKSIWLRLYYEYVYFNKLSKKWKPLLWISMQDSTPRVKAKIQALYFQNSFLLHPKPLQLLHLQTRLFCLWLLYKMVYTKGIKKNNFVVVQQKILSDFLKKEYHLQTKQLLIFPPKIESYTIHQNKSETFTFIFPATPYAYKNFESIFESCKILGRENISFKILLTIFGDENKYLKKLRKKYHCSQIEYLGFLKRENLFALYNQSDCMIFPSLLETWGLPLSEFALQNKPIICADLPYAKETLANYKKVKFFNPYDANELAKYMLDAMNGNLSFNKTEFHYSQPIITGWKEMFDKILTQ